MRDSASPGYPIDPSVDGFASSCVVNPVDGSLWTTNSADTISHFSGTPPGGTPPETIRAVLSRIDTTGLVPPAPESIGLAPAIAAEPPRVWSGFFDSVFLEPDGSLRGWDLPHVTGDAIGLELAPPVDLFGIYEFDIAADGETVFYTSFANTIRTYNIQTGATTVFATVPTPEENYNLRILPPGIYDPVTNTLEGGLIVATNPRFYRLDENGTDIAVYTPGSGNPDVPLVDFWYFGVALTPDAKKFWGASYTDGNEKHGYLYLVDIATGEVEVTLDLGLDGAWGLCVYREYLAATTDAATGCLDSQGLSIPCVAPEACNTPLIDEDGDGLLDANDPDCVPAGVVEVCGNNLDEDADGIVAPCALDHVEGQVIAGNDAVDFAPASAEPDWTYTITSAPPTTTGVPDGLDFDSSGQVVPTGADAFPIISHDAALSGPLAPTVYVVTVSVDRGPAPDGTPRTAEYTFDWSVTNTNRVAELTFQPLDRVDLENEFVTLVPGLQPAFGFDPDCGEPVGLDDDCAGLVYALNASSTLPADLTVDPTTGIVSGTISTTAFDDQPPGGPPTGLYDVTIDIEELVPAPGGGTSIENVIMTEPFDWQVLDGPNVAPSLIPVGDQIDDEGDTVSVSLSATDPDPGDTLTFSATDLPPGLTVSGATIEGTLTDASVGVHTVTVRVEDDGGPIEFDSEVLTWTVNDVNNAPVLDPIGDQNDDEGETIDQLLTAADPDGADTLTFEAADLPPGLAVNGDRIQGTLVDASVGVHTVTITVRDDADPQATDSEVITWTVNDLNFPPVLDPIGSQVDNEGDAVSQLLTATDPDAADALTFSASGLPPGLALNSATIEGTLTPGTSVGTHIVTITVVDDGFPLESSEETFPWDVLDVNLPPNLLNPGNQVSKVTDIVALALAVVDPDVADTHAFVATGLPPDLTINPLTGAITGTLTIASLGTHSVSVTATDSGTPSLGDVESWVWEVNPAKGKSKSDKSKSDKSKSDKSKSDKSKRARATRARATRARASD